MASSPVGTSPARLVSPHSRPSRWIASRTPYRYPSDAGRALSVSGARDRYDNAMRTNAGPARQRLGNAATTAQLADAFRMTVGSHAPASWQRHAVPAARSSAQCWIGPSSRSPASNRRHSCAHVAAGYAIRFRTGETQTTGGGKPPAVELNDESQAHARELRGHLENCRPRSAQFGLHSGA